jgi:hypothetical protein
VNAAPAQAAAPAMEPLSSDNAANSDPMQPTNTSAPTATPAPTQTPLPTATPEPTQTPIPTATSTPTRKPPATRAPASRSAASASSQPAKSAPTIAPTVAVAPLHFSFYIYAYCATRKIQNIKITVTALGGTPPYDYYLGTTLIARATNGSIQYDQDAPAGNPVPYKVTIVDSAGQKSSEDFFYKTHLHCGF